jgi:hypothetical protein
MIYKWWLFHVCIFWWLYRHDVKGFITICTVSIGKFHPACCELPSHWRYGGGGADLKPSAQNASKREWWRSRARVGSSNVIKHSWEITELKGIGRIGR